MKLGPLIELGLDYYEPRPKIIQSSVRSQSSPGPYEDRSITMYNLPYM
ncbi:20264_t:CDS:2 [Gigaspora margarita]|uniref:20264_t:CDS:1 n=1 Tax=Gigaspora margarita TaxID=4874 RepID=A0ABM8W234_GIGMA|nr:20264_t:CDS:2 [Gigaspora margarita]